MNTMITRLTLIITALATSLLLSSAVLADQPVNLPVGSKHAGTVETRNSPITVGNEAIIEGLVLSRNGPIRIGDQVIAREVSSRNGAISIGDGSRVEKINARNGAISLGLGVHAEDIETRNGAIRIGGNTRVRQVHSRNGAIVVGRDSRVDGEVSTRNGSVVFNEDVTVNGSVSSRNGPIQLDATRVTGSIQSLSGDVTLDNASVVSGDLVIDAREAAARQGSQGFFGFGRSDSYNDAGNIRITGGSRVGGDVVLLLPEDYDARMPRVTLDTDSLIEGSLRVDARVELDIADESNVGSIIRE